MNLRERLKTETHGDHLNTESYLKDLMSPQLTLIRYREILRGFQAFYMSLDQLMRLQKSSPAKAYYESLNQKQSLRLSEDLKNLESDASESAKVIQADGAEFPKEASLWGLMYVIEGSSLGGQMIAKHLEKTLGLHQANGASFFVGDAAETGAHWRTFLATLNASVATDDPDATVDGARSGFRWVGQCLESAQKTV